MAAGQAGGDGERDEMNLRRMEADAGCESGAVVKAAIVVTAVVVAGVTWIVGLWF